MTLLKGPFALASITPLRIALHSEKTTTLQIERDKLGIVADQQCGVPRSLSMDAKSLWWSVPCACTAGHGSCDCLGSVTSDKAVMLCNEQTGRWERCSVRRPRVWAGLGRREQPVTFVASNNGYTLCVDGLDTLLRRRTTTAVACSSCSTGTICRYEPQGNPPSFVLHEWEFKHEKARTVAVGIEALW
jgi:hypothetical protein